MKTVLIAALALTAATGLSAQSGRPSQLEMQTVKPSEYGLYSVHQLAMIKHAKDDPDLNSSEVRRRVRQIKEGVVGRFGISINVRTGVRVGG